MEDMLSVTEAIKNVLREHKGIDVLSLDLRKIGAWTDFFIISTATSNTHLDGLERHIKEFCHEKGIEILRRSRKTTVSHKSRMAGGAQDDEWRIIDLGVIVIHLMSRQARDFYELERLYSDAVSTG